MEITYHNITYLVNSMTSYELLTVEDYTSGVKFVNCSNSGVPYSLLKFGNTVKLTAMIDIQNWGAKIEIPKECTPNPTLRQYQTSVCVCIDMNRFNDVVYVRATTDGNLDYYVNQIPARIQISATWFI